MGMKTQTSCFQLLRQDKFQGWQIVVAVRAPDGWFRHRPTLYLGAGGGHRHLAAKAQKAIIYMALQLHMLAAICQAYAWHRAILAQVGCPLFRIAPGQTAFLHMSAPVEVFVIKTTIRAVWSAHKRHQPGLAGSSLLLPHGSSPCF
jgi:hypothetical protein